MKRIVAALAAGALIGCGTAQKKPDAANVEPKKESDSAESGTPARAAGGALAGAAIGALGCLAIAPSGLAAGPIGLPASIVVSIACLPVGIVGGAVVGSVVGVAKSPSSARAATPVEVASRYRTEGRFVLVASGQVEHGDVVPSGDLHVAMNTIALGEPNQKRASLVINFDAAGADGGRSLVAQTAISCDTAAASIHRSFTYGEPNGAGPLIKAEEHTLPKVLNERSAAFSSAVKTVCDAGPWWNTPAHLYGHQAD